MGRVFIFFLLAVCSQAIPKFNKFVLLVFENHGYNQVVANPLWSNIIDQSFFLNNYYAILHASQPNYVLWLAGDYFDCTSENMCYLSQPTILDLLEKKGLSWKGYLEDYQAGSNGACSLSASGLYCRNHNPFMAFTTITGSLERCQKVVNAARFYEDVASNSLPDFSLYVPNNYNNSHDKDLYYSGTYLENFLDNWYYPYLSTTWKDTLLMVTWDEDDKYDNHHVASFLKHPCLDAGSSSEFFNHYSVPLFVEENWNLGSLGQNDAKANNFASALKLTCGADSSTSSDGGLAHLIESVSGDNNVLILLLISVVFLTVPLFRLIVAYRRRQNDSIKVVPSWNTPLTVENYHQSYTSGYPIDYAIRPVYTQV